MNTIDLQRALFRLGYDVGGIDGVMGPKTKVALDSFLLSEQYSLDPNNGQDLLLVDMGRLEGSVITPALEKVPPFIEAAHLNRANRPHSGPIDVIVIHTMEAPEKPKTARNVASWFAGPSAPQASAHYCVDDVDVIQCVLECDVAWHAPGANSNGIGIEHAGYASQTPEQWDDDYSRAVLANSAKLVASLCRRFSVPVVKLSVAELADGGRGIVGHIDCTNAFSRGHGHTDPGPNFPWDAYIALVKAQT